MKKNDLKLLLRNELELLLRNRFFAFILYTLYLILNTSSVYAQFKIGQPTDTGIRAGTSGATQLSNIISNVLLIIFIVGSLGVLIMFVWGATQWILSGGDKEALAKARSRINTALIGFVLLALSGLLIIVIGQVIGINPLAPLPLPSLGQSK